MALFEDKYDNIVRVVTMGDSIELCGGTHVKNTKDIERIAILSLENKGSNTYRIEGTTSKNISKELKQIVKPYTDEITKLLEKTKNIITQAKKDKIELDFDFELTNQELDSYKDVIYYKEQLERLKISVKKLEKEYNESVTNKSISNVDEIIKNKELINGNNVLIVVTQNYEVPILKQLVDNITNSLENAFVLLANQNKDNVNIICKTNINSEKIHCGNIVREICQKCSGNGGGNQFFAQGGGSNAKELSKHLNDLKEQLKN
jgi:alanyl-tRNA synthetase